MTDAIVIAENVSKIYRRPFPRLRKLLGRKVDGVLALDKVNLEIQAGEIFGLVGLNGQGKTTLIKCLATLIEPNSGTIRIKGMNPKSDPTGIKRLVGLVSADERTFYARLTGRQNLNFFARLHNMPGGAAKRRIAELAEMLDFAEMLDRRFQELSSGNKQRLALMRALLSDPELILLDEPTRSLDPLAAEHLRKLVRENLNRRAGKTIFITSHNLEEVENLCQRIAILHRGQVRLCATMEELRRKYLLAERVSMDLGGLESLNGLGEIGEIPSLTWSERGEGRWEAQFERQPDDPQLDRFIERAKAAGAKIENCRVERPGLREIMELMNKQ